MASGRGGQLRGHVRPLTARAAFVLGLPLLLGGACRGHSESRDENGDTGGGSLVGGGSGRGGGGSSGTVGTGGRGPTGGSGDEPGAGGDKDTGGIGGSSGAAPLGGDAGAGGNAGTGGAAGRGGDSSEGGTTSGGSAGAVATGGTFVLGGFGGASGTGGTNPGACASTGSRLKGVLRDFQPTWMGVPGHPDFEPQVTKPTAINFFNMVETGIVQPQISDPINRKPIYAGGASGTNTTIGPAYFPSWFQDTTGVNLSTPYILEFTESTTTPGIWVFDRAPFLPIDDGPNCPVMPQTPCLLGNSRNYPTHNYALTFEFHTKFVYRSGMSFLFSGDDDVWVFVNGALAIDLGGIHQRSEARLNLDGSGLVVGEEYMLDFFWAERHVTQSNFHIETTLDLVNCGIEVPR